MKAHMIMRDAFGTDIATGDLVFTDAADPDQLKAWLTTRASFPLLYSTPHPQFPLELLVTFDD